MESVANDLSYTKQRCREETRRAGLGFGAAAQAHRELARLYRERQLELERGGKPGCLIVDD